MRKFISYGVGVMFLFSILFSLLSCTDIMTYDGPVATTQNQDYQSPPQESEHLADGVYRCHAGYEYEICMETEPGNGLCDLCYRTQVMQVNTTTDSTKYITFHSFESKSVRHMVILDPCSYRQVRMGTDKSVDHVI
jgi:hypothetical protein